MAPLTHGLRSHTKFEQVLNNVFGRAAQPPKLRVELQNDRAGTRRARVLRVLTAGTPWCCKYLGRRASLQACIAAAEAEPRLGVTSVTWHRGAAGTDDWERTCYAIVDGTWQPVPVGPGQANEGVRLVPFSPRFWFYFLGLNPSPLPGNGGQLRNLAR